MKPTRAAGRHPLPRVPRGAGRLEVGRLDVGDFQAWRQLAEGYDAFYRHARRAGEYDRLWRRLMAPPAPFVLGGCRDGRLVGFVHYLFHASCWNAGVCYLQDLFVDPADRRQGVGRALIDGVIAAAREHGASRVYWHTQARNRTARRLYDELAVHSGFIRYECELPGVRAGRTVGGE